jgi:8-oxo-dGTP diphosphatase
MSPLASPALSVAGIVIEGKRVLIARRLPGGDLGGKWEFPGGKAEEGESPQEALIREYDEEFGVSVRVGDFLGESSFERRGQRRLLGAYRVEPLSKEFHLADHAEWRWASLEEIGALDFAPSDRGLLPLLQAYLDR